MARGFCKKTNYEEIFGAQIKAKITEKRLNPERIAELMGHTLRTLQKRYTNPEEMKLKELKAFIKSTDIEPDKILNYLYEKGEYT